MSEEIFALGFHFATSWDKLLRHAAAVYLAMSRAAVSRRQHACLHIVDVVILLNTSGGSFDTKLGPPQAWEMIDM